MENAEDRRRLVRMEGLLAGLLRYGALVASGWMTLGMALGLFGGTSSPYGLSTLAERCLSIGVVLLIALPVLRVALTTAVFVVDRDYPFVVVSGVVLLIMTLGFLLGVIDPNFTLL